MTGTTKPGGLQSPHLRRELPAVLGDVAAGRVRPADDPDLLEAVARGLVVREPPGGAQRLTAKGRTALRRLLAMRSEFRARAAPAARQTAVPGPVRPVVNPSESPLLWLHARRDGQGQRLITDAQLAAGERLRADFTRGELTPRVTMSWSPTPGDGVRGGRGNAQRDITDGAVAARERFNRALIGVGPEHCDILIDVCCHLRGLDDISQREGWPRRSARLLLQRALTALALHYGLEERPDVEQMIARRLRHWGAPGYRPPLSRAAGEGPDQSD